MPLLEVSDLHKHYRVGHSGDLVVRAVDGVSFEVEPGETLAWSESRGAGRRRSRTRSSA